MARLGLLGPMIVVVGAAVAGVGVWYYQHSRPKAGVVIDAIAVGSDQSLVIRDEQGGDRSFLELHKGDEVVWQALIPHYVGTHARPGIAWSPTAVTVRVQRGPRAEVFGLAMDTALKLGGFRLAPEHEPNTTPAAGPITLTDHAHSYELVGGAGWHQLVGVELLSGQAMWKVELGAPPVTDGGIDGGDVWVLQAPGPRRYFDALTGREDRSHI